MAKMARKYRGKKPQRDWFRALAPWLRGFAPSCLCILSLACVDHEPDAQSRQEALLKDPFGYKTDDNPDISGGNINELDRSAIKKDLDHVLNP